MFFVDVDSKKRPKKEENRLYPSSCALTDVFLSSPRHYVSVVDIETEDKKKSVDLILDGEYYGGVYRVRFSVS